MATAPTATTAAAYLGDSVSWTQAEIESAFNAEAAAQRSVCRVPVDPEPWPDDLVEALHRRVAHNLANRALPLGVKASIAEYAVQNVRVGGTDAEVKRLEAPYRKLVVG